MTSPLPPAMSAGRVVDPLDDTNGFNFHDFDALQLSVPVETTKYDFVEKFLTRVMNLKRPNDILLFGESNLKLSKKRPKCVEILPQVAVPPDLWLEPQIAIQYIKIKNAVLKEVNQHLRQCLDALRDGESPPFDESVLLVLESRIKESNFLDFARSDSETEFRFSSLNEEDEEESPSTEEESLMIEKKATPLPDRPISRSRTTSGSFSHNMGRLSSFSRDIKSSTRKFSFLSHQNTKHNTDDQIKCYTPPQTPPQSLPIIPTPSLSSSTSQRDVSHSSLLSKSKLYKKIKKRRELAALVSTTATSVASMNSGTSMKRKSNANEYQEKKTTTPFTTTQQYDNQKDKYEYYCQLGELAKCTGELIKHLNQTSYKHELVLLMDFIKAVVFKFILIDVSHMIIDYGHIRMYGPQTLQ